MGKGNGRTGKGNERTGRSLSGYQNTRRWKQGVLYV